MRIACIVLIIVVAGFAFGEKAPNACKLMTAQDVESTFGSGFKILREDGLGTSSENSFCLYKKGSSQIVDLSILPAGNGTTTLTTRQKLDESQGFKTTPVDGLGESAFSTNTDKKVVVHFVKGPWHVILDVQFKDKSDLEATQKLAKVIYARML